MANLKGARQKGIEFWRAAVERLNQGESVQAVAQALGVDRRGLERWRDRLNSGEGHGAKPRRREAELKKEVEKLKQALAGKSTGGGFFARCLAQNRGATPEERKRWRAGIYDQIREVMPVQGSLSAARMCQLSWVSRAGFYRSFRQTSPVEEEMMVRAAVQKVALEHRRCYGYRRIARELEPQAGSSGESGAATETDWGGPIVGGRYYVY